MDSIFVTHRNAKNPSLYAVELINEPVAPGVSQESLNKYYKAGYEAVRKPREFLSLASGFMRSVIDVHYYSLFSSEFDSMTVQQNIDFVHRNRTSQLNYVTTSNGPRILLANGQLSGKLKGATKEECQKFAEAQLHINGHAPIGWAYWTLKNVNNHWSLEWMIKNGYIKL